MKIASVMFEVNVPDTFGTEKETPEDNEIVWNNIDDYINHTHKLRDIIGYENIHEE